MVLTRAILNTSSIHWISVQTSGFQPGIMIDNLAFFLILKLQIHIRIFFKKVLFNDSYFKVKLILSKILV